MTGDNSNSKPKKKAPVSAGAKENRFDNGTDIRPRLAAQ
jgi:hypothetical protein